MIRRDFIKGVAAGVGAVALGSEATGAVPKTSSAGGRARPMAKRPLKVVVIGGGITGLCCGYELMKSGADVVVLEADGRYGGHVFTGRDGLSDGLYADFGADHITRPGYEVFFEYLDEFGLDYLAYPNAEGSPWPYGNGQQRMIDGKFYDEKMLADASLMRSIGFSRKEADYLATHPWHELNLLYLSDHLSRFGDVASPFGHGMDALDTVELREVYRQGGASDRALRHLGGTGVSALYAIWRIALKRARGIPSYEGEPYRVKGGNDRLPAKFSLALGDRLKLNHPVLSIEQDDAGVHVTHGAYGHDEEGVTSADFVVNCVSLPVFRGISVDPPLSEGKQYVVDNLSYTSHPFYVFEAASRFWEADGLENLCMQFEHSDISMIWTVPEEISGGRVILKATGPSGLSPLRVLAAFRELYPGKPDTIEQALTKDWSSDRFAPTCEMQPFPVGQTARFWPEILRPEGRLYFAGTYADPLSRGMESCLRSARRVAAEILER